jgi:hypothetical protein
MAARQVASRLARFAHGASALLLTLGIATLCPANAFEPFTVREPVLAVVGEELLVGEAIGHLDRTGTLAVHSALDASLHCQGNFRFTSLKAGRASIHCSDGSNLELDFNALSPLSGWGQVQSAYGLVSFTFGLSPQLAAPYLNLPKGKRLVVTAQGPRLQDG